MILSIPSEDWRNPKVRQETLKEARARAQNARARVIIKTKDKYGSRAVAVIDGRFYVGRITRLETAGS